MAVYHFPDDPATPFSYLRVTRWLGPLPPYETALSIADYLRFATDDVAEGTERGLVNAFGNVKRALHLTIDTVLHQYGLFAPARKLNFPDRLRLLDAIGVLPTGIVENLNVERNLIEHDYVAPERRRVVEASTLPGCFSSQLNDYWSKGPSRQSRVGRILNVRPCFGLNVSRARSNCFRLRRRGGITALTASTALLVSSELISIARLRQEYPCRSVRGGRIRCTERRSPNGNRLLRSSSGLRETVVSLRPIGSVMGL
jgi:hypothetical protein